MGGKLRSSFRSFFNVSIDSNVSSGYLICSTCRYLLNGVDGEYITLKKIIEIKSNLVTMYCILYYNYTICRSIRETTKMYYTIILYLHMTIYNTLRTRFSPDRYTGTRWFVVKHNNIVSVN